MKRIFVVILFLCSFAAIALANNQTDSIDVNELRMAYESNKTSLNKYRLISDNLSQDTAYSNLLVRQSRLCFFFHEYKDAIDAMTEASEIYKTVFGDNHPHYRNAMEELAQLYILVSDYYDYKEAIKLLNQAKEIIKSTFGIKHPDYVIILDLLSYTYSFSGEKQEAIRLKKEALEILEIVSGKNSPEYATALSNLASYYIVLRDYGVAIKLETEALKIIKLSKENEPLTYALELEKLAIYYSFQRDYKKAIQLLSESLEIKKGFIGVDDPDYARTLIYLADNYHSLGDDNKALRLATDANAIFYKNLDRYCSDYVYSLRLMAGCYSSLWEDGKALQLAVRATNIYRDALGEDHLEYADLLLYQAILQSKIGNHDEAIILASKAIDIQKQFLDENDLDYANSLNLLASYYSSTEKYDKAIPLIHKAMEITAGQDQYLYLNSLFTLSGIYRNTDKIDEAIQLLKESLQLSKKIYNDGDPSGLMIYAGSLGELAFCHALKEEFKEAVQLDTEAQEIICNLYGKNNPLYAEGLKKLAFDYYDLDQKERAVALIIESFPAIRFYLLNSFIGLTSNERFSLWDRFRSEFTDIPLFITHSKAPYVASILYDYSALFAKGLLLSTEIELAKIVQESGDAEAVQMYSELRQNRQLLNSQYSKPIAERDIDCDSLENISSYLERQLVSRVKEFGDYTRNLNITWKDVQSKLGDSDIAIEYLSYPQNDNTIAYIALTLCKNDTAPVLTPLFTNLQLLDVAGNGDTYQNAAADELIWGPLASRLEGKSHIYFSAAGMLHNIGIEYLSSMKGKECYRLSSTRELVTHKPSEGGNKNATLFGGIHYDATYASLRSTVKSESNMTHLAENTMPIPPGKNCGGFNYSTMRGTRYSVIRLPHSKTEIQEISAFLKNKGFVVQDYDTIRATEESFKALTGQRKSLIHISTHGFYYDVEEAENKTEHMRMMLMGENRPAHVEDQSLLRCGLCFAGANQAFTGESLPADSQDDGILNALEIAQTDLRGLDLVVLSACQTALGDVVNGEGVFGLQRGFKKAGAKSILMSLWEVYDEVTSKFMIEFYRQWTSGKTKMEALKNAQSVIRQEYPDPQHWAAFILLDALD